MNDVSVAYFWAKVMARDSDACQRLSVFIKDLYNRSGASSLRKFAKNIGVSYSSLRMYENKEGFPTSKNLILLAKEANITVDELLRYLQYGDNDTKDTPRPKRAEDVLELINEELTPGETVKLIHLLAERLAVRN